MLLIRSKFQFLRKCFSSFFPIKATLIRKSERNLFGLQSVYRYNTVVGNMDRSESESRIVWIDLEMTGLDLDKDRIIEMACIITDKNLNIIAKAPSLIINQPDSLMDSMNDWCKEHHGKSGLTDAVKKSLITQVDAENKMLKFVQEHTPKSSCPLAGNSVHVDRMFLQKYMPNFMNHLHYRIIDVSSIKELCRRWYPKAYDTSPPKALTHRALDDIEESIKELEYYRKSIFSQD